MSLHISLDLETLGTGYNAAIISIGAVKFDPYRDGLTEFPGHDKFFYAAITHESAKRHGTVDQSTLDWWGKQSLEAREAAFNNPNARDLMPVLVEFDDWARGCHGMWGNGATFDNVLLRSAYKSCRIDPSWSFRLDKCYRTAINLLPRNLQPTLVRVGTFHNALDDAITQALHLQKVYRILGVPS